MSGNLKGPVLSGLLLGALLVPALHGQGQLLPTSISPDEVEIRMIRNTGGGCPEPRCVYYRVTISGDGMVRYEDLADPPVPQRNRRVPVDEVLALVNDFVRGRFLEAPDRYVGQNFYVLQGGQFCCAAQLALMAQAGI